MTNQKRGNTSNSKRFGCKERTGKPTSRETIREGESGTGQQQGQTYLSLSLPLSGRHSQEVDNASDACKNIICMFLHRLLPNRDHRMLQQFSDRMQQKVRRRKL